MTDTAPNRNAPARKLVIDLSIMAGIGLLLALIGPFGTFSVPFAWRLIYWLSLAITGFICYSPICRLVLRLGDRLDLPRPASWVAAVLIASVPMTVVVVIAGQLPGKFRMLSLEGWVASYGSVLIIGGFVTLLFQLIDRDKSSPDDAQPSEDRAEPPTSDAEPAPLPPFFDRLPATLGSELFALEMEDHYVRAHTALGSELILLRMRDAVAELGDLDGQQVHRSWWVARNAVEDVQRDGRNVRLILPRGIAAPVSRANVQRLRDMGWF